MLKHAAAKAKRKEAGADADSVMKEREAQTRATVASMLERIAKEGKPAVDDYAQTLDKAPWGVLTRESLARGTWWWASEGCPLSLTMDPVQRRRTCPSSGASACWRR